MNAVRYSLHPLLCIPCAFQDVDDRDVCWFLFGCLSMDAVCCVCKTDIEGSWNMICNGNWNDLATFIIEGHFLCDDENRWMDCYCKECWEREILKVDLHKYLKKENEDLQAQCKALRDELEEMKEKIQSKGIPALQELFNTLSPPQIQQLESLAGLKLDTFQGDHQAAQLLSSNQFLTSSLTQFKDCVQKVIKHLSETKEMRMKTKDTLLQLLLDGSVPETVRNASLRPLQAEIEEIVAMIEEWSKIQDQVIKVGEKHTN